MLEESGSCVVNENGRHLITDLLLHNCLIIFIFCSTILYLKYSINYGVSDSGKQNSKSNNEEETRAFMRRQRTAVQLETLTEFAEHHLYGDTSRCVYIPFTGDTGGKISSIGNISGVDIGRGGREGSRDRDSDPRPAPDLERVALLVEACLRQPGAKGFIVRDWTTMSGLLLRESNEYVSTALRPTLSSILLRIFIASAMQLREWHLNLRAIQLNDGSGKFEMLV